MECTRKSERGFTLMEMLIAVAILVILMAVAFISVISHQREMKRMELDATAKEIFIAAQNHLTLADTQGVLSKRTGASVTGPSHVRDDVTYNYFFYDPKDPNDQALLNSPNNVLYDMLPSLSLDDTVRKNGSYVIEYDLASATVTNVFYSDQSSLSNVQFTDSDYARLFEGSGSYWGTDEENPGAPGRRLAGFKEGDGNTLIGWYGGKDAKSLSTARMFAPSITLINAECLEVKVSFPIAALNTMKNDSAVLQLFVHGERSGEEAPILSATGESLSTFAVTSLSETVGDTPRRYKVYTLDDITQAGQHFVARWCTGSHELIPGEDVTVRAKVFTNAKLANIAQGTSNVENSLFGTHQVDSSDPNKLVAKVDIANFRHLENLDAAISGYDIKNFTDMELPTSTVVKATQTQDLRWRQIDGTASEGFIEKVFADKARGGTESAANKVRIWYQDNTKTNEGCFGSVSPRYSRNNSLIPYVLEYEGGGKSISNVVVNSTGASGLFGSMTDGKLENTVLQDFMVASNDGNAGALAGSLTNTAISNVVAYNTASYDSNNASAYQVSGSGNVGGLVGNMTGGSITASAAALYVRSTAGVAGGLVGTAQSASGGTVQITDSYSGGHTDGQGKYIYDVESTVQGKINVLAQTEAGGLVGKATGTLNVSNCYSTCSVAGNTAGGLLGSVESGKVEKCYSTGIVVGQGASPTLGGFVGTASSPTDWTGNYYLHTRAFTDASAEPLNASSTTISGVNQADTSLTFYQAIASGAKDATTYDAKLRADYGGKYPYKTTSELAGTGGLDRHYGDWPAIETQVVNTKP